MLADWYWLCGHSIWTSLPPYWGGMCTLVKLYEPTAVFVRDPKETIKSLQARLQRQKRAVSSFSDIHMEHRIWGGGAKFAQSLFPMVGLEFVRDHVEINRFELMKFVNVSILITDATKKEMTGLRMMVIQNRMVLDQVTALAGGVCVMVGETCCTYIPENDSEGGLIHEGLNNLCAIQAELQNFTPGDRGFSFPNWFTGWKQQLLQIVPPILVILTIFAFLVCCAVPCVKGMISKLVSQMVGTHIKVEVNSSEGLDQWKEEWVPPFDIIDF